MLVARPTRRVAKTLLRSDACADLFADEQKVGFLVYRSYATDATIELRGQTFRASRALSRIEEMGFRGVMRFLRGEKAAPNPITLSDAVGRPIARAVDVGWLFVIDTDGERFEFRPRSLISRRFDLSREGGATPLGSVGPKSPISTNLIADLPPDVPELLQAFLFVLVYDKGFDE
jgi:hypothetical protein